MPRRGSRVRRSVTVSADSADARWPSSGRAARFVSRQCMEPRIAKSLASLRDGADVRDLVDGTYTYLGILHCKPDIVDRVWSYIETCRRRASPSDQLLPGARNHHELRHDIQHNTPSTKRGNPPYNYRRDASPPTSRSGSLICIAGQTKHQMLRLAQ